MADTSFVGFIILLCASISGAREIGPVCDYLSEQLVIQCPQCLKPTTSVTHGYMQGGPLGELSIVDDCACSETKRDCLELYANGCETDGVYHIDPSQAGYVIPVFCDMTKDGGGWTVFQRRVDASVNFFRNWDSYVTGFGQLAGNHWLGLETIYQLTKRNESEIEVSEMFIYLEDFDGNSRYAKYSDFYIDDYMTYYTLHVTGYSGTAGDNMDRHNNNRFAAYDFDVFADWETGVGRGSCAQTYNGGWWYATSSCHDANLNGFYLGGPHSSGAGTGVNFRAWKGHRYSLKTTEMKVRRR